jgi:transcriptional regulator with XRE-family HTH domain
VQRFGEKLRTLRKRNNMSYVDLAQALGYSSISQISQLENNKRKPTAELVIKIAKLFHVTTDVLLLDELELEGDAA